MSSIDYRLHMVGPDYLDSSSTRHRKYIGSFLDVPNLNLFVVRSTDASLP